MAQAELLVTGQNPAAPSLGRHALFFRLGIQDLAHRPGRILLLALAMSVGGAAVFCSLVLRQVIQGSLESSVDRLGADMLVLPKGVTPNLATALLTIEPDSTTITDDCLVALHQLPGLEKASPQRHFSIPAPGGHGAVDWVAFDPAVDFTVGPWVVEQLPRPFGPGDVVVGARRPEALGATIAFQNVNLTVHSKLGLTGVGLFERSIFASFATTDRLAEALDGTAASVHLPRPVLGTASGVLLRLGPGLTPEKVRFALAANKECQVVTGSRLGLSVRLSINAIVSGALAVSLASLAAVTLMVGVVYAGILSERGRELGILLAIGMRPKALSRLIVMEAGLCTGIGGAVGVLLGALGLVIFLRSLGYTLQSQGMPFAQPGLADLFFHGLISVAACSLVGMVGAWIPAWVAGRSDSSRLIRGEGA